MTLIPDKHNFQIWKGGTFRTRLTLYEDAAGTIPRDLTGHTASLIIRPKAEGTPLLSLATGTGITVDASGNIDLFISDEITAGITWKTGVYDLLITSSGGDTDPLLYGQFIVRGV